MGGKGKGGKGGKGKGKKGGKGKGGKDRGKDGKGKGGKDSGKGKDGKGGGRGKGAPTAWRERPTPTEAEVGIHLYMTPDIPGTGGLLKCRYTDFLVNEVADDKSVIHLTDLTIPMEIRTKKNVVPDQGEDADASTTVMEEGYKAFNEILGEETGTQLRSFFEAIIANKREKGSKRPRTNEVAAGEASAPAEGPKVEVAQNTLLPVMTEKDKRTKVHQTVKDYFPWCVSDTVEIADGTRRIRIMTWSNARSGDKRKHGGLKAPDGRTKFEWPAGRPDHLKFVLFKQNMDTIHAVSNLAYNLGMPTKVFGYAGTKDRRGATTQEVTLHKVNAEKIMALNNHRGLGNMKMGNFSYVPAPLKLGHLAGNRFSIILRQVEVEDSVLAAGMEAVMQGGFINYFGLQRFGTSTVPTHAIGLAILKSNFEEAVQLIIGPKEGDEPELAEAKRFYAETKDAQQAMWKLNRNQNNVEYALLTGLKSATHENDYLGALSFIPRNLRTMYVHSYQSLVWNSMTSKRLEEYDRTKAVEGDLVMPDKEMWLAQQDGLLQIDSESAALDDTDTPTEMPKLGKDLKPHVVTAEEAASGKFPIDDVVLPLPGMDVLYPTNKIGEFYKEQLAKDDVSEVIAQGHRVREYSLPGAYRAIVGRPQDLQWDVLKYSSSEDDLGYTDLDAINELPVSSHDIGDLKALKIAFTLPASTYATMLLREVMKTSTSASFHRNQEQVQHEAAAKNATGSTEAAPDAIMH